MKFSTRGMACYISDNDASLTADAVTAVTNAAPAVVTPTTIGSFNDGDLVWITGTGMASVDDKYWIVANKGASTFELKCSDASGESAPATGGSATPYGFGTDLLLFCINSFGRDVPAAEIIDVSTFCGREQLLGEPELGTISWGGPLDFSDAGFQEMMDARQDGLERVFVIVLPKSLGYLIYRLQVNQYSDALEINAAGTWSGGAIVTEDEPQYLTC